MMSASEIHHDAVFLVVQSDSLIEVEVFSPINGQGELSMRKAINKARNGERKWRISISCGRSRLSCNDYHRSVKK